jgi:Cu(I)/Ag(I) efflux system membrane fusion protein
MEHTRPKNILLFFLVIAVPATLFTACKNKPHSITFGHDHPQELWTCPMHPEIIRNKPGVCPICGMDLIKKKENAVGIKLQDLLQPTDGFIVSSIPVTTISKREVHPETEALGTITYDTRLINTISARVSGRIEKLYVRYRYQHVMKGERIMDIYSPEIQTASQELLFLIKNDPDNHSLINAGKQRLLLLGMSESQLQQMVNSRKSSSTIAVYSNYSGHVHEAGNTMPGMDNQVGQANVPAVTEELPIKEGMYIQKGQTILQLFGMDKSWVLLSIFPEKQAIVKVGYAVKVVPETTLDKTFMAKIDFIEPLYRNGSKTLMARVYFDNSKLQIPIGSQVRATISGNSISGNWLGKDAVLSLGLEKVVFISTGGGFKVRKIETGLNYHNEVQVLSGLTAADSVAANAQFLVDSEGFIKIKNKP